MTIDYVSEPNVARELAELVSDVKAGSVETLLILGGNPAYDAPADFGFTELLPKIARTIHFGLYPNETAARCHWHIPEAHPLESWSDARALDGTVTIVQPMIEPLFAGRSRHELLSALLGEAPASSYEIVRAFWQKQPTGGNFERDWRKALHDGVVPMEPARPRVKDPSTLRPEVGPAPDRAALHLLIRPSARLLDGSYANNAWLPGTPGSVNQDRLGQRSTR